jgi:hypothetical protein
VARPMTPAFANLVAAVIKGRQQPG